MARPRSLSDPAVASWLKALGERVRVQRKLAGLTQNQLAERADLAPRVLQKLEAGKFSPLASTIARVRRGIGCKIGDLMPD